MPYHPRLENSSLFRDCFSLSRIIVFRKSDRAKVLTISIFHFLSPFFALLLPSYRYDSSRSSLSLSLPNNDALLLSNVSGSRYEKEIRHIPRLCDNRETREGAAMATTVGSAGCPTQLDAGTFKSRDKTFTALPRRWSMGKSIRSIYRPTFFLFRLPFLFQSPRVSPPPSFPPLFLLYILDIKPKPSLPIGSSTRARQQYASINSF